MLGEIYWDDTPATVTRVVQKETDLYVSFGGKINEYGLTQSGCIILKMTTEAQVLHSVIEYKIPTGNSKSTYVLEGAFEDDSYELFSGSWRENGDCYQFDILLEPEENDLPSLESECNNTESVIEEDVSPHNEQIIVEDEVGVELKNDQENEQIFGYSRIGANRQRATRSDARVRTIQRKIELYYGLPQGSVRLVNPDRSIIHPSAKIRTLRERWMFDE
jgi:hypothetical protein